MSGTRVVIAVLTFRRSAQLRRLLPMLLDQAADATGYDVCVLVVDNDAAASAREVADAAGVRCVVEPVPGIAIARNRALDESAGADLLIFVDDDEWPREQWLARLLQTYEAHDCVAVAGAVECDVQVPLTDWLAVSGFFDRRRMPTGTVVDVAASNNLLLDLPWCAEHGLRFDPAFALTGGEDTHFTRTLVRRGGRIVWCNEAQVVETVTADRADRRWALGKAFSAGNGWARSSIILAGSAGFAARLRALTQGLVRVTGGMAQYVLGVVTRSLRHRALGTRSMARGAGLVAGAVGIARDEYRR